jgi:hypothetical protein
MVASPIGSARRPSSNSCKLQAETDQAGRPAEATVEAWTTKPAAKARAAKATVEALAPEATVEAWTAEAAATTMKATATTVKATTAAAPAAPAGQLSLVDDARRGLWSRRSVRGTGKAKGRKAKRASDCARANDLLQDHEDPLSDVKLVAGKRARLYTYKSR